MNDTHPIPPITDPLGRHWSQPDRSEISVSSNFAKMTRATFAKLPCYDSTLPTGVYDGKMWARRQSNGTLLCWFGPADDPTKCSLNTRKIILAD